MRVLVNADWLCIGAADVCLLRLGRHCQNYKGLWSIVLQPILEDEQSEVARSTLYLFHSQKFLGDIKFDFVNRFRASQMCGWILSSDTVSQQFLLIPWLKSYLLEGKKKIPSVLFHREWNYRNTEFVPITHIYSLSYSLSLFSSPLITTDFTIDHNYYDTSYILVMGRKKEQLSSQYDLFLIRTTNFGLFPTQLWQLSKIQ